MSIVRSAVVISVMTALLSACVSTEPQKNNEIISNEDQILLTIATQYQKDTVALSTLADKQLKAYDKNPSIKGLENALATLKELIERQPHNQNAITSFYRLTLYKGFAYGKFDVDKWTTFYQKHHFLTYIDLAPPQYMAFLLSKTQKTTTEAQKKMLIDTIKANPNFINAYVSLANYYEEQAQLELAIEILNIANNKSPDIAKLIVARNQLRMEYAYDAICTSDITNLATKVFNETKQLIKSDIKNASYHNQLSLTSLWLGKNTLSKFSAEKAATLSNEYYPNLLESYFWSNNFNKIEQALANKPINSLSNESLYILLYANLTQKNWQKTAELAEVYILKNDINFYGVMYGSYAYRILGDINKANKLVSKGLGKTSLKPWQKNMLAFNQEKISSSELLNLSENNCNKTEALFLSGLDFLAKNDIKKFNANLTKIISLNIYPFYEYAAAKNLLKNQ